LQGAIVPILVCWVRHCLNILLLYKSQDYYLSSPQETGTDPVFIFRLHATLVLLFTCMSVLKALQSLCCMFYIPTLN